MTDPVIIDIPDEGSIGARMLNAALAEERGVDAPSDGAEPEVASPAPVAIADEDGSKDTGDAEPAPAGGGLGDARNFEYLEDGQVKLANGHTYASADAAMEALFHAQQHIATTRRAPEPEPQFELEDEDEPEATPLLRPGQPIGGEPQTVEELVAWALDEPAEAGQWALGNQDKLRPKDVADLWAHWMKEDPAGAANYQIQIQKAEAQRDIAAMRAEVMADLSPVLEERRAQQVEYWTQQIQELPLIEHYGPRIQAFAQAEGQEYLDYLQGLSPQDEYEELRDVYSRMRVDDSIAASRGDVQAQQVLAATAAATPTNGGRPVTVPPPGVPGVEQRGGRGPAEPVGGDMEELVRQGIAAYKNAGDPFGDVPT